MDTDYTQADHSFRENDAYAGAKYDITLRWLSAGHDRQLLNIGCGAGLFNELATKAGFTVEACEPDPAAFKEAVSSRPENVTVHEAGLFDVDPEIPPQIIVMHDVLEHIDDEGHAVDRLAELLPSEGTAIISVPALPRLYGLHDELLGHYRRYTSGTLRMALGRRFEIQKLRYFGASFIPITYWFSRSQRKPYPSEAAASDNFTARAFRGLCKVESHVSAPIGTSLICMVRPKPESQAVIFQGERS